MIALAIMLAHVVLLHQVIYGIITTDNRRQSFKSTFIKKLSPQRVLPEACSHF